MITLPARPESLTFAPQQSALIVVDMQNAYASQGGYLDLAGFDVSATRPVIDNINVAVAAAFPITKRPVAEPCQSASFTVPVTA